MRAEKLAIEQSGIGLSLRESVEWLDPQQILHGLSKHALQHITHLDTLYETTSTNQVLLDRLGIGTIHGHACLAEYQSAGRGRQGKHWVAPLACGICLSLGWHFNKAMAAMGGLSLAVGIALAQVVSNMGLKDVKLKWPNDLMYQDCKLAGILIETQTQGNDSTAVVIGIGMNVLPTPSMHTDIPQPWLDLSTALDCPVSRNQLATAILNELIPTLQRFQTQGFTPFKASWRGYDLWHGHWVKLRLPGGWAHGQSVDVDDQGNIVLENEGQRHRYSSGQVSLYLDEHATSRHR